jgi:hypothetical protein
MQAIVRPDIIALPSTMIAATLVRRTACVRVLAVPVKYVAIMRNARAEAVSVRSNMAENARSLTALAASIAALASKVK